MTMTILGTILLVIGFILGLILLSLGAYLIYPLFQRQREIQQRAAREYEAARGTQHRKMLEQCLKVLQPKIDERQAYIAWLKQQLSTLGARENDELDRALLRHQLETNIAGIGSQLAAQIERQVYRGDLNALRYAETVSGVGPKKQAAINYWLLSATKRWASWRAGEFPRKKELVRSYQEKRQEIQRDLQRHSASLKNMEELAKKATSELSRLRAVSKYDFVEAYQMSSNGSSEQIAAYLTGTFAEWEEVPDWFKTLISKYSR